MSTENIILILTNICWCGIGFLWGYYTVPVLIKQKKAAKLNKELTQKFNSSKDQEMFHNPFEKQSHFLTNMINKGWTYSPPVYDNIEGYRVEGYTFIKNGYTLIMYLDTNMYSDRYNELSGFSHIADKNNLFHLLTVCLNDLYNYDFDAKIEELEKEYQRLHSGYNSLGAYKLNANKRKINKCTNTSVNLREMN